MTEADQFSDQSRNDEDGAASNLWRHTLARIPSLFGRISYLASLRNANTGMYEHHGFAQRFSAAEADQVLRASHIGLFNEWLALGLQDQKLDLEEYLSGLDENIASVIATWVRLAPYQSCLPVGTRAVERELFMSDFHIILEMLMYEHAVASPDPDA